MLFFVYEMELRSMNMQDYLEDEEKIMNEQSQDSKSISIELFQKPIMDLSPSRAICLDELATVSQAIEEMQHNKIGSVLITKSGIITGIFTERDVLMKIIGKVDNWKDESIRNYMTSDPTCLRMSDAIAYALHNMHFGGFRHVPIVDNNQKPIAIVSIKDINNYLMDYFPNEIDNIMDEPFRGKSIREGA